MAGVALVLSLVAAACSGGGEVEFSTRSARVAGDSAAFGSGGDPDAAAEEGGLLPAAGGGGGAGPGQVAGQTGSDRASGAIGGGGAEPGSKGVIKVGTVLPLQGGERDFGEPILRATQAFIDELNARGGVNGYTIELVSYSACLLCQQEALQAVRRLVEIDKVFALVNPYVMVVAFVPVIPYLVDKNVPLIQGGALNQTSDALSPINFATAPPGAFYAKFIPRMVTDHLKGEDGQRITKIGITYIDQPSEAEGIATLIEEFAAVGVDVVHTEAVAAAEEAVTNMDGIVIRMRAAGAEAVVATNPILVIFGRLAASRQQWEVPWAGPAAWSRLVEDGCAATCDDIVLTDTAGLSFTTRDSPQMRQFLDTMNRRYPGGDQTGHTLAAWVGMQLLVETLARIGDPDRQAFIDALNTTTNLDLGTTSALNFNPDRHLGGSSSVLIRLKDGKYCCASEPLNYGYRQG